MWRGKIGQAIDITTEDNVNVVEGMVREKGRITAYSIIKDKLNFQKMCARWAPKEFSAQHMAQRLDITRKHLAYFCCEGRWILTANCNR